jgi:hypothetical protein
MVAVRRASWAALRYRYLMLKKSSSMFITSACLLLASCAVERVAPGASHSEVLGTYGQPAREVPIPGGTRLQYSRLPAGQTAVMVDLDAQGRVVSTRQVLQSGEFARIVLGSWSRADVEREFGPPYLVDRVASWQGDIMNYTFREGGIDLFFFVYLDTANIAQRTGQAMDTRRDPVNDQ